MQNLVDPEASRLGIFETADLDKNNVGLFSYAQGTRVRASGQESTSVGHRDSDSKFDTTGTRSTTRGTSMNESSLINNGNITVVSATVKDKSKLYTDSSLSSVKANVSERSLLEVHGNLQNVVSEIINNSRASLNGNMNEIIAYLKNESQITLDSDNSDVKVHLDQGGVEGKIKNSNVFAEVNYKGNLILDTENSNIKVLISGSEDKRGVAEIKGNNHVIRSDVKEGIMKVNGSSNNVSVTCLRGGNVEVDGTDLDCTLYSPYQGSVSRVTGNGSITKGTNLVNESDTSLLLGKTGKVEKGLPSINLSSGGPSMAVSLKVTGNSVDEKNSFGGGEALFWHAGGNGFKEYYEIGDGMNYNDILGNFVTLNNGKLKIATSDDEVLGVVSNDYGFVAGTRDYAEFNIFQTIETEKDYSYDLNSKLEKDEVDYELKKITDINYIKNKYPNIDPRSVKAVDTTSGKNIDPNAKNINKVLNSKYVPVTILGSVRVKYTGDQFELTKVSCTPEGTADVINQGKYFVKKVVSAKVLEIVLK